MSYMIQDAWGKKRPNTLRVHIVEAMLNENIPTKITMGIKTNTDTYIMKEHKKYRNKY